MDADDGSIPFARWILIPTGGTGFESQQSALLPTFWNQLGVKCPWRSVV